MLGEQIGDIRGQSISTRILPDEGAGPRLETTDQGVGTLCGVHVTSTVTYIGTMRPNGTIQGEGIGVVMGDGGEMATFRARGVGTLLPSGGTKWSAALFYESATPKLGKLNAITAVAEYSVDEGGKSEGHLFEWK